MELIRLTSEIFRKDVELRSSLENPQTPLSYPAEWLLDAFGGGRTDAGVRVSEMTAFQVSTFLACVDIIAGSLAALPMHIYERSFSDAGRAIHRVAYEHDVYDVVNMEPNEEMTRFTLMKTFMCHCLAWGNGYIEIQRDRDNSIIGLWPRNPAKTTSRRLTSAIRLDPDPWRPFPVTLPAGTLVYVTTEGIDNNDPADLDESHCRSGRIIPDEDMLHVPGLSFDGRIGQSVVSLARQTIGLALATEKYGAKYFANFARPGGILELPANIAPADKEKAKQTWQEAQGGENAHRAAVLPPGFKWTSTSNMPEEAQLTETQKFIRQQICAFMHVPPHMVGDVDKGKANTEQLGLEFIQYTLTPWLEAIRPEWKRKLFPHKGKGRTPRNAYFVDFDLTGLIRPDAASREKFNASGKQWGYLNTNDINALEGRNPVDQPFAEEYWMPVNMTLATTPINPNHQDGAGNGIVPKPKNVEGIVNA